MTRPLVTRAIGKFYTKLKKFTQPAVVMVVTNIRYDQLVIIYEVIIYHMIKQMRHYIEISKGHKTRVRNHVPRRPTTDRTAHPQCPVRLEEDSDQPLFGQHCGHSSSI